MPVEATIDIHASEITEIVGSVFGTMMNLEVLGCETHWEPGDSGLTSAVHLTGDWCGAVLFECDRHQACRFAARFLAMGATPDDDASPDSSPGVLDDVVRDVLGEIANMIGGNLKCVLSRGTRLSMPSVVDGDFSLRICGAVIRERLRFTCAEGIFRVTILTTRN